MTSASHWKKLQILYVICVSEVTNPLYIGRGWKVGSPVSNAISINSFYVLLDSATVYFFEEDAKAQLALRGPSCEGVSFDIIPYIPQPIRT